MSHRFLLPSAILALMGFSLLILKSISPQLVAQQALYFLLGFGVFFAVSRFSLDFFYRLSLPMYLGLVGLLVITLVFGHYTKGSTRWLPLLFGFHLQASQLAVPVCLLFTQHYFGGKKFDWHNLGLWTLSIAIVALLIFVEPDLGTTLIFGITMLSTLIFLRPKWQQLILLGVAGLGSAIFLWAFLLKPYQKSRLESFFSEDTGQHQTYNADQALIAVGSGQIWGRGLGLGVQSQLRFLPEKQTDFIFASIAEETGFLGSLMLILTYAYLIGIIWRFGVNSRDKNNQFLILTLGFYFLIQITINIGMNIGLLPITGVTLLLVSFGGSSIIATCLTLGLIQAQFVDQTEKAIRHIR